MKFLAPDGSEVSAVTSEQMREVDRIATHETGPGILQMMENAGRSLASLAIELLGSRWPSAVFLVLAGGGGNGGGGICAARHLANHNAGVRLCLAQPDHMSAAAQQQLNIFRFTGGKEITPAQLSGQPADIILDALIGSGLKSSPRSPVAEMISWANGSRASILSLDVPSGMDASTGDAPGQAIRPAATMTLALPKTGLLSQSAGSLYLADIGIPKAVYARLGLDYQCPFADRYWVALRRPAG